MLNSFVGCSCKLSLVYLDKNGNKSATKWGKQVLVANS